MEDGGNLLWLDGDGDNPTLKTEKEPPQRTLNSAIARGAPWQLLLLGWGELPGPHRSFWGKGYSGGDGAGQKEEETFGKNQHGPCWSIPAGKMESIWLPDSLGMKGSWRVQEGGQVTVAPLFESPTLHRGNLLTGGEPGREAPPPGCPQPEP